jgi:hypothetical protein
MATASADLSTKIIYLFTKFSTSVDNKYMPPKLLLARLWHSALPVEFQLVYKYYHPFCVAVHSIFIISRTCLILKPKKKLCRQMQLTSIAFNDYFETYFGSAFEFIDVSVYIRKVRLKTKLK